MCARQVLLSTGGDGTALHGRPALWQSSNCPPIVQHVLVLLRSRFQQRSSRHPIGTRRSFCICQGACLQPTHQRYDIDKSFCNVGTAYNPISIALLPLSQVTVIAATVTTVKLQVSVDFATTPLLLQCCNFTDFYPQQHYACLSNLVQDACH